MGNDSVCPHCGVQLAVSSLRAHVAQCESGGERPPPPPRHAHSAHCSRSPSPPAPPPGPPPGPPRDPREPRESVPGLSGHPEPPTLRIDLRAAEPFPARDSRDSASGEHNNHGEGSYNGDGKANGENSNNGERSSSGERTLERRLARAEAENRGLRKSVAALEREMRAAVSEIAALHAAVGGAAKSAEAAQKGVRDVERRVRAAPAQEEVDTIRCKLDELIAQRSNGTGHMQLTVGTREASSTGDMVARLLHLRPAAVMHTGNFSMMASSSSRAWV